jgi:hypothetical protein
MSVSSFGIEQLVDSHKGQTAWVVANGPSTQNVLKQLAKIRAQNMPGHVFYVTNEIDDLLENVGLSLERLRPDYWVVANSHFTVEAQHTRFNKMKNWGGKLLYSNSVDLTPNPEQLLEVDYLPYDQRHFNGMVCQDSRKPCCAFNKKEIGEGRSTVQEALQSFLGAPARYGTGSTVALHMLAFAIISGCEVINVSGVDLNYSAGYFDGKSYNPDSFTPWMSEVIEDFTTIKQSIDNSGHSVKVIVHSQTSPIARIFNKS